MHAADARSPQESLWLHGAHCWHLPCAFSMASRLAAADLKPVGKHMMGVQARIGRYTHCSTPKERQQAKGFKPAPLPSKQAQG